MRVGSMFSGYGGAELALQMVYPDAHPVWFVEYDRHPSTVLAARWPGVLNYGDVTSVDWTHVPPVDVLTGGFPCQDLSHAGKRLGLRPGTRSGLWEHMAYAVAQLRPRLVLIENVRGLLSADAHSDLEREQRRVPAKQCPRSSPTHQQSPVAGTDYASLPNVAVALLPTPVVNDMGDGKTPPPVGRVDGPHEA